MRKLIEKALNALDAVSDGQSAQANPAKDKEATPLGAVQPKEVYYYQDEIF